LDFEVFDLATGQYCGALPNAPSEAGSVGAAAAMVNGELWICGGSTVDNTVR